MFKGFDAGKLKGAVEGIQNAAKSGSLEDAAKEVLKAVPDKAPEQLVEALRELLAKAKELLGRDGGNQALKDCVEKAGKLLEGKDISAQTVTELTAELGALLKGAGKEDPKPAPAKAAPAAPASRSAQGSAPAAAAHPAAAQAKPAKRFADVEEGAYYFDAVQWAVEKGIASGTSDTTFSPDDTCTRAQTITFLWRAAGSPAPKGAANPFEDVKEGAYYYDAALWAAGKGIASGKSFSPDAPCTRAQAATFLYRNAGSPAVQGGIAFEDVKEDAYYRDAVAWVAGKKITSGTSEDTFSPDAPCTRGQIVTFLYRAK